MRLEIENILNEEVAEYNFSTTESMDNNWSLSQFIKDFDLADRITFWDECYIEIDNLIGCHSGGNGDFYSHKIRFVLL